MAGAFSFFKELKAKLSLVGQKDSIIGLDIGSSSIKIVELKRKGTGYELSHFGMVPLPDEAIVNREFVNTIAVTEGLKTLVVDSKVKGKGVCTSVSGASLIIKRMGLDVENIKEIDEQVLWEAEQYIPFDISEVVIDYQTLTQSAENHVEVLLSAVKRDVLESVIAIVEDAGLKATVVDTDFFALHHVFEASYPEKAQDSVALIDIGANSMRIVVTDAGSPVFTKDAALGGRTLTAEIQKHLKVSASDAEALKVSGQGQGVPQEVGELMTIASENFALEIKRTIDFYNASSSGAPVTSIMLTGGAARNEGLAKLIEERVGLPAQLIDPFASFTRDEGVFSGEYLASIADIASISVGLALRAGAGLR